MKWLDTIARVYIGAVSWSGAIFIVSAYMWMLWKLWTDRFYVAASALGMLALVMMACVWLAYRAQVQP